MEPPRSGWSRPPHCSHARVEVGGTECGSPQQLLRPDALILSVQFCFASCQVCTPPPSVLTMALPLCCHLCLKAPPLRPSPDISSRRNKSPIWKPPSSALSPMVLPDSVGCRQAVTGFSLAGLASALLHSSKRALTWSATACAFPRTCPAVSQALLSPEHMASLPTQPFSVCFQTVESLHLPHKPKHVTQLCLHSSPTPSHIHQTHSSLRSLLPSSYPS